MPDQDLSIYGVSTGASTSSVPSPSVSNLGENYSSSVPSNLQIYGQPSGAESSSPLTGQTTAPIAFSDDPWYKKAWNWANTPLTESLLGLPETRPGAGGFERGAEKLIGGLTSPLSLALGAATFGTGSLIESTGATALKEALTETGARAFTDEEIPQIIKASQAAIKEAKALRPLEPVINDALKTKGGEELLDLVNDAKAKLGPMSTGTEFGEPLVQEQLEKQGFNEDQIGKLAEASEVVKNAAGPENYHPITDAIKEAGGADYATYKRAQDLLKANGLDEENDLLGGNALTRGAFQILRKALPTVPVATTATLAKGANTLLNAGFTLQQFQVAAQMSPLFLDALKEGDYDKAWEYGTEAGAGALLGVLGAPHALHAAGELFSPALESSKLRPSDEWAAVQRANQDREATHAVAEQHAINIYQAALQKAGLEVNPGPLGWSKEQTAIRQAVLDRIQLGLHTGGDLVKASALYDALKQAVGEGPEGGTPVAPVRPLIGPNPDVQKLAQDYTASQGIDKPAHEGLAPVDTELSKRVADAYEEMQHNPDSPEVKASYDALKRETKAQWDAAKEAGYVLEPWTGEGQPYANSAEMAEDVKNNKHLYYFQGGELPEGHPLADIDPATGETYNNIFRAVHDLFGHAKNGYEFGPRGEENAFLAHSHMYSDQAIPALLSETKGQNSWVNFGQHLRNEEGNVPAKGEKGYVALPARPYAEQKAGILPPEIVNQYLGNLPKGTPLTSREIPSRTVTQVLNSNEVGEVRIGTDGRPVVWLNPEVWGEFERRVGTGKISGFSYSPEEADDVAKKLAPNSPIRELFTAARNASKQGQLTGARVGTGIDVVAEELHHTWQRELANNADISSHLAPEQWRHLYDIIPKGTHSVLDEFGYPRNSVVRVAETAAKFMSGLGDEFGASPKEVHDFLVKYYNEVKARHGKNAVAAARDITEIARQHIKEIYDDREKNAADILAKSRASREDIQGARNGERAGTQQSNFAESEGNASGTGENKSEGLSSRELTPKQEKEFDKLSTLSLRGGVGDARTAGIITNDGEVKIGRLHDDLIRQSGYKASSEKGLYEKFFEDGGVRVRAYGGIINIDFMDSNPETWDRVRQALLSSPDSAGKYSIEFRTPGGGFSFHIQGWDKEGLLQELQDWEDGRTRPAPVGSVNYFRQGLFSREPETWDDIKGHLTSEQLAKYDTPEKQNLLVAALNVTPDRAEYSAAARAGKTGQLWYERSSRAFDALLDSGAEGLKPTDKEKFLNFTAALSPVQPVRQNLLMALNLWSKWDKAGRPTDVEWKGATPANKNSTLYRILKGRGNTQGVDLPSRMNNAIRALQGEPMSGPKVSSFAKNMGEDANRVTNDTWMAVMGGHDPNRINKPAVYDALSVRVNQAAKDVGVPPRQAQAAIWSFIKSLAELSGWGNDRWIPPQEIIKQGLLTPDLVAAHSADFADLLQNDPEIRGLIKKLGGNLDEFDQKLKSYVPGRPIAGETQESAGELLNSAQRLEAARKNSRVAAHLARKSGPSLFDTEFRPVNGLFSKNPKLNGLPDNIEDLIRTNVFKDMPKEYRDRIFGALEDIIHNRLTPQVLDATKYLRDEDDRNYQYGSTYNLIHSFVQDHMTRQYKDKNPEGKVVSAKAKTGSFATNVSQARQQVYDSFATALLKSPNEINFDPANIISGQRGDIIKAAANRQFIDQLRDKFTKASDGRPAVVLGGSGRVVAGENGENPTTFVSPERIRKLHISDAAVAAMQKSGDLERFLEDGTVKDLTPKVRPNTINAAIDRLEEQGISKEAQYDTEGNNILRKNIQLLKDIRDGKRPYVDLKDYNDSLKPVLAWDPQDYISLNHGAFKDWNFVTNDTAGNKVLVKSDIRVHPEFADYLKNRLGLGESSVSNNPVGRALLGAAGATKHVLLSLSPFHMAQEALRAIMIGVNPFGTVAPDILTGERIDPSDPHSPTIIKKAVEHGLTTGTDYKSLQAHSEGVSAGGGLLRLIPGVGKTIANSLDWYQDYLFKRYIPALKARGTELVFHEYQRLHPEWSTDRIAKVTADHVNRTFGGINWQAMGRSATTQDWGRLMLLAPDWLESEARSGAALFNKEEGGLSRAQVAKMALGLWGVSRVLNLVTTGNAHYEAPFGLAVKNKEGKETVFGIRTLPTDLLHAASDPAGFLKGRLSPVVRTGEELVSGRDQFGRKLGPQDLWADVFHQMMPIPVQSIGQAVSGTGPEVGNPAQGWKAIGGTAQTYSSPAQQLAANLAANHTESGPIDPAQMARHRRIMEFEDQARAGQLSWPELMKMTYQTDQISEAELKQIQNNVKKTQGMDPAMAALYTRASRLPAKEFLDLWDVSNPREKTALIPLMTEVQKKYLTKAKKEMTPADRQRDPTFNRLLHMIPPQPAQPQQ